MIYRQKIKQMLNRLQNAGITDQRVLLAMAKVPRHEYVPTGLEFQAYDEKALPIGFGQTISHPYTVAIMSQLLSVKKGDRILEIGTGSGYQAAVLCAMGAQVFTIEKIGELAKQAERRLKAAQYHFVLRTGDGSLGWHTYAPYDAIIVTAGAPIVPDDLFDQLKNRGRMLIPVGNQNEQILTLYLKEGDHMKEMEIERLNFVPLKGREGW